ncbi:MAG: heme peroxidase family protein [Roseiflexaceae bacterium]
MAPHGVLHRALAQEHIPRSAFVSPGVFGRIFPMLASFPFSDEMLAALNTKMEKDSEEPSNLGGGGPVNPRIPAGFTFFGQFIDHDITFDPTSSLERQNDPEAIHNFRTPLLELDSLYGAGPVASPHLYDLSGGPRVFPTKFLLGLDSKGQPNDLPRNRQGTALLGDPRNDENLIISQLHVAFLRFHNSVVDFIRTSGNEEGTKFTDEEMLFADAQRIVRWHYQWIILHEFLPLIVGEELVANMLGAADSLLGQAPIGNVLDKLKFFRWNVEPFIPIEFAVAAYRFGHSQVRAGYRINNAFAALLFPSDTNSPSLFVGRNLVEDAAGHRVLRADRLVDWARFNQIPGVVVEPNTIQESKKIDGKISPSLFELPTITPGNPRQPASLPHRNLLRGRSFNLPWGQAVAYAMGAKHVLSDDELELSGLGFPIGRAPLWYYILKEAEVQHDGEHLGEVGGRIVAEVLLGLLLGDQKSFLSSNPSWTPFLEAENNADFRLGDLFKFAGVGTVTVEEFR